MSYNLWILVLVLLSESCLESKTLKLNIINQVEQEYMFMYVFLYMTLNVGRQYYLFFALWGTQNCYMKEANFHE